LSVLTSQAVRLSALVAAAVSAGYLWRAALEHHAPQKALASVPPAIHFQPNADLFNSLAGLRAQAAQIAKDEAQAEKAPAGGTSAHQTATHASGSEAVVFIKAPAGSSSSHGGGSTGSSGSGNAER
jgi:hypothetical protein